MNATVAASTCSYRCFEILSRSQEHRAALLHFPAPAGRQPASCRVVECGLCPSSVAAPLLRGRSWGFFASRKGDQLAASLSPLPAGIRNLGTRDVTCSRRACCGNRGIRDAHQALLKDSNLTPQEIDRLDEAYGFALRSLDLADRTTR